MKRKMKKAKTNQDETNCVNAREIRSLPNKRKKTKFTSEERLANILENSIEPRDKIQRDLQVTISKQDDDDKSFFVYHYTKS